jgi:phosphomannomutase
VSTIDGVRVDWPDGFGLIRASNTTPVLVLRFEGHTLEALHRIEAVMLALLLQAKPDAVVGSAAH